MSPPTSDPPAPDGASNRRRWLAPALVISLAFNLVIVGTALSDRYWPHERRHGSIHRSLDLLPRRFFAGLDEARRKEIAEAFRARKSEFRAQRSAIEDAAAGFADALEQDPYDPEQARSAISEHARKSHQMIDLIATVAEDLAAKLTPEERKALAAAIRHRIEQDRERRERRRSS